MMDVEDMEDMEVMEDMVDVEDVKDVEDLAVCSAAGGPCGGVAAHLARPWALTETFLFNAQRRFKPRSQST